MTKVIVTTTINPPTEALRKFGAMPDWDLVVIGDKKTPTDFHIEGATYVTPDEQEAYDAELSEALDEVAHVDDGDGLVAACVRGGAAAHGSLPGAPTPSGPRGRVGAA